MGASAPDEISEDNSMLKYININSRLLFWPRWRMKGQEVEDDGGMNCSGFGHLPFINNNFLNILQLPITKGLDRVKITCTFSETKEAIQPNF